MTSWPSKSTLQRLLDLAGLRYTTSEKSGPSWQSMLRNFLSRPLSFLGWTTAMLFWLVFHQTQSNLYKWFRMLRHDWSSMSPKEPMLHLSSSHCTGYQWQLASSSRHWCLHTERPQAQHPPTSTHYYESTSPPEVWDLLVSDALWYHHREAQNHSPEHSHSPFLDGGIIFPPLSGMLDPCQSSSNNWRLISFGTTWLPKLVLKKKKKKKKPFPLSFSPSLASLYLFEQWLRLGVTSTSSVWLPLQDESLYVLPNCKSLWIKASAKWLNVNVVHPKMKILASFTHPQVVPNLYEHLCSAEHKGRYSEEWGKQSSSGAPLTSIVFFLSYYGSQWCPKTAWLQTFFKISSFVFGRTKTFIQVWNYMWVNDDRIVIFGWTIPLMLINKNTY